jgi:hypothetical protein
MTKAAGLKCMEFDDQHREAIGKSVRAVSEVTTQIFDDKVKPLGTVKVARGVVTIKLDYPLGMVNDTATRDFLMDSIRLGLEACYDKMPDAFDPFSK